MQPSLRHPPPPLLLHVRPRISCECSDQELHVSARVAFVLLICFALVLLLSALTCDGTAFALCRWCTVLTVPCSQHGAHSDQRNRRRGLATAI